MEPSVMIVFADAKYHFIHTSPTNQSLSLLWKSVPLVPLLFLEITQKFFKSRAVRHIDASARLADVQTGDTKVKKQAPNHICDHV